MKYILASDLDNTLVGDEQALSTLNQSLLENRQQICLVYATGRSYASARELQKTESLLEPDFWITGVGSEIYRCGVLDQQWATRIGEDWNRSCAVTIAQQFRQLIPQEISEQNPYKISYLLAPHFALDFLSELQLKLTNAGLAAQVVFSSNRDVDILPAKGDKGCAVIYLRDQLNIAAESTVVCGDSGNDISLFKHSKLGIIVGNAQMELLDWYRNYGKSGHYLSQRPYASGILEGLRHFEFFSL